jgi:DNA-binding PadR family transcriptional regulator
MRAITELTEKGFIDITHSGSGGVKGDKSKYAISERWRDWGTDRFIEKTRKKDTRQGRGFAAIWKRRRANMGIKNDTPPVIKNDTP